MMLTKQILNKDDLTSFTASNSWLEKFKLVHRIHEMWILTNDYSVMKSLSILTTVKNI